MKNPELTSRRAFFRQLVGKTITLYDEMQGRPHFLLSDLADLPDHELGQLIPMIIPGIEIKVSEEEIAASWQENSQPVVLFAPEAEKLAIYNRINGENTIEAIGAALEEEFSLTADQAFAEVKDFFLNLVNLGVCVPFNSPPEDDSAT